MKKINTLELEKLKHEFVGMSDPSYVEKRMFGEIQKKINEIIEHINH